MASEKGKILRVTCVKLEEKKRRKYKTKEVESSVCKEDNQKNHDVTSWGISSRSTPNRLQFKPNSSGNNRQFYHERDECSCSRTPKAGIPRIGILKKRPASVLPNYPNNVRDQARFREEYEIFASEEGRVGGNRVSPSRNETRPKKIRFRIPDWTFEYEDAKKAMWKRGEHKWELMKYVPTRLPLVYKTRGREESPESISNSSQIERDLSMNNDGQESVKRKRFTDEVWDELGLPCNKKTRKDGSFSPSKCRKKFHNS